VTLDQVQSHQKKRGLRKLAGGPIMAASFVALARGFSHEFSTSFIGQKKANQASEPAGKIGSMVDFDSKSVRVEKPVWVTYMAAADRLVFFFRFLISLFSFSTISPC